MTKQFFSLTPFPAPHIPKINIRGAVSRRDSVLSLHYVLTGNLEMISLPTSSLNPSRKDELWKTTCFELFLAIKAEPQYWELNLSPSGDWNAYHMDAYRRIGFREETSIQLLQFERRREAGVFTLDAEVDLTPIVHTDQRLEAGVTAVIQTGDGNETYWALNQPALQADFHRRESFTLTLAGQTRRSPGSAPES